MLLEDIALGIVKGYLAGDEHKRLCLALEIVQALQAERERCARIAEMGYQAPTDGRGICKECGKWTPAWHKERGDHEDTCKEGEKECSKSALIARKIRETPK